MYKECKKKPRAIVISSTAPKRNSQAEWSHVPHMTAPNKHHSLWRVDGKGTGGMYWRAREGGHLFPRMPFLLGCLVFIVRKPKWTKNDQALPLRVGAMWDLRTDGTRQWSWKDNKMYPWTDRRHFFWRTAIKRFYLPTNVSIKYHTFDYLSS